MKHRAFGTLSTALLLTVFPAAAGAQTAATTAESKLQEATHHELVLGELDRAIALYREVLTRYSSERGVTARTLANLGRAYEKLGSKEARTAYERVVREYGDQPEPARFARGRLQALSAANDGFPARRTGAHTLVLTDLPSLRPRDDPQFDFSPDGERVVYRIDVVSDSLTGTALTLTNSVGTVARTLVAPLNRMGIRSPRWSPDGKQIAFIRRSFVDADSAYQALIVVPADGGPERILTASLNMRSPSTGGIFWTPDSRAVSVTTGQGVTTVDLSGRTLREVPLHVSHLEQITGYSPDGRWLAMHRREKESEETDEMDIWVMPAEGGRAIQVTREPGFDGWPSWAADGRNLHFVSARSGSLNVWRVEVDPASGLPRGEPAQVTNYTDARILYPRSIDGGRKLAFTLVRQTSAVHVGPPDSPGSGKVVARGERPILSPDGRTVYFLGEAADQRGIFAAPVEGGKLRRLTSTPPGGDFFQGFAVSPGGESLAYFSRVGPHNVLSVTAMDGGKTHELVRLESREQLVPSWSRDGSLLAYSHGNGLYVVPARGGEPRKLAHLYRWDGWTTRWSPDGEHIAALAWAAPNTGNAVFAVPASGGEARRLTPEDETGYKEGLEWHPDGRRLSYMYYGLGDRGDGSRLAYLDGRPSTVLVDQPNPQWDYVGLWNPSGRDYYFLSAKSRSWDLFAHDERTGATRLVFGRGDAEPGVGVPSFSADGRLMTWTVIRTARQLWTIDLVR